MILRLPIAHASPKVPHAQADPRGKAAIIEDLLLKRNSGYSCATRGKYVVKCKWFLLFLGMVSAFSYMMNLGNNSQLHLLKCKR